MVDSLEYNENMVPKSEMVPVGVEKLAELTGSEEGEE